MMKRRRKVWVGCTHTRRNPGLCCVLCHRKYGTGTPQVWAA